MFTRFLKKTSFRRLTNRLIKQSNQEKPKKPLHDIKTRLPPYIEKQTKISKLDIPDGTYIH
tara:strand:- start:303 stop:485 length:183 start_codon:yes stop_codon:yes gene_type:complete